MKAKLDTSASVLIEFLNKNKDSGLFEFPFSYSFPRNCCESVSLIFTYLVEEKYNHPNIQIIKGSKHSKNEFHFWVQAGDLLYDLTAHQFPRRKPIIGALAHPFFFTYPEWEIEPNRDFVDRAMVISLFNSCIIPF